MPDTPTPAHGAACHVCGATATLAVLWHAWHLWTCPDHAAWTHPMDAPTPAPPEEENDV